MRVSRAEEVSLSAAATVDGAGVFGVVDNQPPVVIPPNGASSKAPIVPNKGFFQKLKDFFLPIFSTLLGFSEANNKPYLKLHEDLKEESQDEQSSINVRAGHLFEKTKKVVELGKRNIEAGKEAWEGLSPGDGVPMSAQAAFLSGGSLEQHYYHNCLVNYLAEVIGKGLRIVDSEDLDGTNTDKSTITFGTALFQANSQVHENRKAISAAIDHLNFEYLVNTARSVNPTAIYARNQGLEGSATIGILNSALEELAGFSIEDQLALVEKIRLAALNGSFVHTPNNWTYISNKMLRADEIFRSLGSEFIKEFLTVPIKNHEFSAGEPKGLTDYMFDTKRVHGEFYYPHYLKIVHLKEQFVDMRENGKAENEGWEDFKGELLKNVDSKEAGIAWQNKSKDLKSALEHVILLGSPSHPEVTYRDSEEVLVSVPNYYELLKENPQAFFERVTQGRLSAICFHFFNSRGIPLGSTFDEVYKTLGNFADRKSVREKVRSLNISLTTNGLHSDIENFVKDGKAIFKDGGLENAKTYLRWRLLKHMMHLYTKEELSSSSNFDCTGKELAFSKEFLSELSNYCRESGYKPETISLQMYIHQLIKLFGKSNGPESELVDYINNVFPPAYIISDGKSPLGKEYFHPDELFSVNNKCAYTGEYSFFSVFTLVDKRNALNPEAQYYLELQPAKEKFSAVPKFSECKDQELTVISSGDSLSDTGTHVAALERGGIARIIYNQITDKGLYEEAITQRIQYVEDAKKDKHQNIEFAIAKEHFGVYGLEKVLQEDGSIGYRKVVSVCSDGQLEYLNNDETIFTREDIVNDIKQFYANRIERNPSPAAKIRRFAEIISLITGRDIEFVEKDFELAKKIYKENPTGANLQERDQEIFKNYKWAIIAEQNANLLSQDATRFRVFYEYRDLLSGGIFYRRKSDGILVNKENPKELFLGDEDELEKIPIKRNEKGDFVRILRDDSHQEREETYLEPDFLNNCLCEEELLPSVSPVQGLFANKKLLRLLGLGSTENGSIRLKSFITKLPNIFNKTLEWCGGLMALGGVLRLLSKVGGGESLYKAGYWLSNSLRAASAFAGAMRGELNVNKYHDIFGGEMINIFSAIKLPNGLKHLGLGIGNLVLFLGRGRQRLQQDQRVNSHTEEEIKSGKPDKNIVDLRPYAKATTKFSTEGVILKIKQSATESGLPPLVGEIVGNISSAILTPIKVIQDIVKEPKLITQIKKRMSEMSGEYHPLVPSSGHLLTLVGVLSGLGALVAGTFGRMGELAEDGFNRTGKFAISFANAIPALGIIANGLEVAANSRGLPKLSRGLDGKDVKYDPKRAGFGQVLAGLGYAILPWLGLHRDSVAAGYDMVTGLYFGLPKARMSVAEEEKLNTIALGRNILIEGQEFYKQRESSLIFNKTS